MLEVAQRYVLIVAIALWLGGLSFYGLVVVPTGTEILGGTQQGFITQQVTRTLNLIGCGALVVLSWDLARQRRKRLTATWLVLVAAQVALMTMHPQLDRMLNPQAFEILDEARFHPRHELYLTITAVQWLAGLMHLGLCLWIWRAVDLQRSTQKCRADPADDSRPRCSATGVRLS